MTYSIASITQRRIIWLVTIELNASERHLPLPIYGAVEGLRKNTKALSQNAIRRIRAEISLCDFPNIKQTCQLNTLRTGDADLRF